MKKSRWCGISGLIGSFSVLSVSLPFPSEPIYRTCLIGTVKSVLWLLAVFASSYKVTFLVLPEAIKEIRNCNVCCGYSHFSLKIHVFPGENPSLGILILDAEVIFLF